MIFGEINSAITLIGRISGMFTSMLKRRKAKPVTSVSQRFVELFEAHGVRRNQIPRVLGHGLSLSDLVDDASLLPKLTEPVLDAACSLFGVRREWLDEAGEEAYIRHAFYEYPGDFQRFIEELKAPRPGAELTGYLVVPEEVAPHGQAILILAETIVSLGNATVYRYHLCDTWTYDYWKSRAYLTACVAIAWKNDVYVAGRYADRRDLSILAGSGNLPGPVLDRLASDGRRWYAEDLALCPDLYLQGVDPETDRFGVISALRLWLDLDDEGWMDTGIQKTVRPAFEAELASSLAIEHPR
jgi:hypothetical protein